MMNSGLAVLTILAGITAIAGCETMPTAEPEVRSGTKDEPTSWAELDALISVYSQRIRCRLENARVAESNRVDCLSGT